MRSFYGIALGTIVAAQMANALEWADIKNAISNIDFG